MPITRAQKEDLVQRLAAEFGSAESVIVVEFKGIDVPQATELRRQVRSAHGKYRVVKNNLARRAIEGTPYEALTEHISGTTAVAFSSQDPVVLAKTLMGFAKKAPVLTVKAAVVQGQQLTPQAVKDLAALPSKDRALRQVAHAVAGSGDSARARAERRTTRSRERVEPGTTEAGGRVTEWM